MNIFNDQEQFCDRVFSSSYLKPREKCWKGNALFLDRNFVIRQRYKTKSGETLHLVPPDQTEYQVTKCGGTWFLSGLYERKRVIIHVFFDEVTQVTKKGEYEIVMALNLMIMNPALGAELMKEFGADEKASLQTLMPWSEWQVAEVLLGAIYDAQPELEGPDPVDITGLPVIVAYAESAMFKRD